MSATTGVAVVGAGHWGPNLIRNFHDHPQSEVRWVIERDATRLEEVRARFPGVRVASDVHAALGDPRVDAVVVATPTSTHHEVVKAALLAGKHVLVEKPLATDVHHGEELVELGHRAGRVLMVGHVFLYNAAVREVRHYIESGTLGRVYYVSMVRTNLGPIRGDVNAAWDLASHDVSIANYWLQAEPVGATAWGGAWLNEGIEDAVFATLRYPNGVLAHLHASWLHPRKARDITVVGDRRDADLRRLESHRAAAPVRQAGDGDAGPSVRRYLRVVSRQRARRRHHDPQGHGRRAPEGRVRPFPRVRPRGDAAAHRRHRGARRSAGARGDPALVAGRRPGGARRVIPLVDLGAQRDEIGAEVDEGFASVLARTAFVLGDEVEHFERELAAYVGVRHCIGVANGTDALELVLRATGVGAGDEVVVPANTFIATALAVVRAGATPVFVDCDPIHHLIDPAALRVGARTRAIIAVHLYGQIAPMEALAAAAPGVTLIEDAAQAHGAQRRGRQAGSFGAAAGTSFYPAKNLGGYGDGGGVLTDSAAVAERVRALRNYGGVTKYRHTTLGMNSRLDTLQAVVLRAKLKRLTAWNAARSRGGGAIRRAPRRRAGCDPAAYRAREPARLASLRRSRSAA